MGDAEVIPLGTRGRPGRGSGSSRPSSAARTLAASGRRASAKREPDGSRSSTGARPAEPVDPLEADPLDPDPRVVDSDPLGGRPGAAPSDDGSAPPGAGAQSAPAGIPVEELLQVLRSAAEEVLGERWESRVAEMLAFLRRRVNGEYDVDEYGFDQELTEKLLLAAARPLADKWFRVEVRGAENLPTEGGALVVSNHSGTIPLDGLMTMVSVHDSTGRNLRPLGADLLFRLPFLGELARKGGVTLASHEDAQRMLCDGELVGVWPEGFKGIGKPYSERYKLQRFGRGGFVSAAIRTGVPIIPCSVVGAEEIYPLVGNVPALARLLGLPYLPITPFFPWLGPLGLVPLPSKWLIEFGEPIRTDSYDEGAADDPMLVFNVTDQVRETIQQTLYTLLMQRRSVFH